MSAPTVVVEIKHRFGPAFALDVGVEFACARAAFFGPSGAGKSSLLGAIAGLWTPQRGRIVIDGVTVFDATAAVNLPPRARRVGYVPQDALLFPLRTVRQNLEFGRRPATALSLTEVAAALEIEHLLERRPRMLSGGERQRVALGRAILSAPRLLVCDEPFAALDVPRRNRMIEVLHAWCEALSLPLVFVSHDVVEVRALANRVAVLDAGSAHDCVAPDRLPDPIAPPPRTTPSPAAG